MKKAISLLLAILMLVSLPMTAFALEKTVSPYTGSTYTHSAIQEGKTIHHGIDISSWNQTVDWDKAKKNVEFAIIRIGYRGYASNGSLNPDKKFKEHIEGAKKNGIKVGVYFYSQAITKQEAIDEANYTLKLLGNMDLDLPIVFDYEFADVSSGRLDTAWREKRINRTDMTNNALAFLDTIRATNKYEGMIYANRSFLSNNVDHTVITKNGYRIWVAEYNRSHKFTGEHAIWQYSSSGKNAGLPSDKIDCNFWYGDLITNTSKFEIDDINKQTYTGEAIKPIAIVRHNNKELVAGTDYYIEYKNNIEIGTATATIIGINEYKNEINKTIYFDIVPQKVECLSIVSHGINDVKIKWNPTPQATGYRVQVYRSGAWKTYDDTTSTELNVTGLTSATQYSFRVAGYKSIDSNKYIAPYCASVKEATTPAKTTKLAVSTSAATSITLSWSKQSNATGYQVQQYDFATKKYNTIKEVDGGKNNSYKVTGLKANTKYQFRVRTYKLGPDNERRYGAYSDKLVCYTKPNPTTLKSLSTPAKKQIKTTWTKASGVAGYQVQWSTTSNFASNYKSVYVTGASKVSTIIKTYSSNRKYYVRVRSYINRDGKKVYSSWSNTKSIKTK